MVHYLHPEHRLIIGTGIGTFSCNCCHTTIYGMSFHCASCKFNLHPKCAFLTSSAVRDGVAAKIRHFSHKDPLFLRYFKAFRPDSCKACNEPAIGLAYCCGNCAYALHKSCAELVPFPLEHPLHPQHPLILQVTFPDKNYNCSICCSELGAFRFYCKECVFFLCIPCATNNRLTLKHQLHEHTLPHFERSRPEDRIWCNSCGKTCSIDLYRCTPCNFNLHHECLPLPPTIQHECHPLVLFDRFVEGLPEYQYCDICEELRNPDHGVYRYAREECWYTVHIGCVLPEMTRYVNPDPDELRNEIGGLMKTIKAMEIDLKASKQKLERLIQKHQSLSKHEDV